jgi:hypothetical protein
LLERAIGTKLLPKGNEAANDLWTFCRLFYAVNLFAGKTQPLVHISLRHLVWIGINVWFLTRRMAFRDRGSNLGGRSNTSLAAGFQELHQVTPSAHVSASTQLSCKPVLLDRTRYCSAPSICGNMIWKGAVQRTVTRNKVIALTSSLAAEDFYRPTSLARQGVVSDRAAITDDVPLASELP